MDKLDNFFSNVSVDHKKEDLIAAGQAMAEEAIESGMIDPVEWAARIEQMKTLVNSFSERMKREALSELSTDPTKSRTYGNVKVSYKENTGARIQYDKDPVIAQRKKLIKAKKEAPEAIIVDEDGVQVELPPVTPGKATITFTQS